MTMYRVPVMLSEMTYGCIEVEADDAGSAVDLALSIDQYRLRREADWGMDEWEITVEFESDVEEVIEPTVSDNLWR